MHKVKENFKCPCDSYNIKIVIESEYDEKVYTQYCPICGVTIEELDNDYEEQDD